MTMFIQKKGSVTLRGRFCVRHFRDGEMLSEEWIDNTITNAGVARVAGLINGVVAGTDGIFKWLALDSSSTAATATDTALASEITANGLTRAVASTVTRVTTDVTDDTTELVETWTATGTQTVQGVGMFDTSTQSAGNMLARQTFTAKNMENNDTLQVTYDVDVD